MRIAKTGIPEVTHAKGYCPNNRYRRLTLRARRTPVGNAGCKP
jgi:hypothetical protein